MSIPLLSPVDCALALLQEQQTLSYRHRMAIRDVAKKLGYPADIVEALAKSRNWFDGGEVSAQLAKLGFDPKSRTAQQLLQLVGEIIGFPRHLSQHVGRFVISQHPLSSLVPVENAAMPDRTIIHVRETDWLLGQSNGSNSLPSRQVRRQGNAAHPIE